MFVVSLLSLGVCACSEDPGIGGNPDGSVDRPDAGTSPCSGEAPDPACNQACTGNDCPSGFHCAADMTCHAQCTAQEGCPPTHMCNTQGGLCRPVSGPCASATPPEGCGRDCTRDSDCPFAPQPMLCIGSICTAECVPSTHEGCPPNEICQSNGFCAPGERPRDAGMFGDGSCAPTMVTGDPVTPTIILIVDQSGSMESDFGGQTRWQGVDNALTVMPGGLVTELQGDVRFGMVTYYGSGGGGCSPQFGRTDPALNNFTPINDALMAGPVDNGATPSGAAVSSTVSWLRSFPEVPDNGPVNWNGDPVVFVFATDGAPNCGDDALSTCRAVESAYQAGIRTYVISVGAGFFNEIHLNQVADTGQGVVPPPDPIFQVSDSCTTFFAGSDPNVHPYAPTNQGQLTSTLQEIVGGEISCNVELAGSIQNLAQVCTGSSVTLNGNAVPCLGQCGTATGADGWCALDAAHIQLRGSFCEQVQSGMSIDLRATFQCGFFVGT